MSQPSDTSRISPYHSSMFAQLPLTHHGVSQADATALYIATPAPTAASPLQLPPVHRARQQPDTLILQLGIFCVAEPAGTTTALTKRQECDHAHHMADLINDKTDGFLDDLLPHALIMVNESHQGCVQGLVQPALTQLSSSLPNMIATIGPSCSNDVAEIAHSDYRSNASANPSVTHPRYVILSPSSTAPSLANETHYPNVVRLSTNELQIGRGNTAVSQLYSWRKVAILHDSSLWARETALSFANSFTSSTAGQPPGEVLNLDDMEFDLQVSFV